MLLMIKRVGLENCRFVFADTGNEDAAVFEHLDYLRGALGITIDVLRADFSDRIANKRTFIARDQRHGRKYDTIKVETGRHDPAGKPIFRLKKVGPGRRVRWSNKAKRRALSVLHPTGNPFLDLCLWKGRFPSRKTQFCTQELKTLPLVVPRLAEWERLVGMASKRGASSFFPNPNRETHLNRRGIHNVVQWAKTTRGGFQFDLIPETDSEGCSSSFGLCEQPSNAPLIVPQGKP